MYVCRTLWEWVVRFPNKEVILAAAAAFYISRAVRYLYEAKIRIEEFEF